MLIGGEQVDRDKGKKIKKTGIKREALVDDLIRRKGGREVDTLTMLNENKEGADRDKETRSHK